MFQAIHLEPFDERQSIPTCAGGFDDDNAALTGSITLLTGDDICAIGQEATVSTDIEE